MGVNEKGRSEKVSTSVPLGTFEALNNLTLLLSLFLLFKNSEKKILPVRPKLMFKWKLVQVQKTERVDLFKIGYFEIMTVFLKKNRSKKKITIPGIKIFDSRIHSL